MQRGTRLAKPSTLTPAAEHSNATNAQHNATIVMFSTQTERIAPTHVNIRAEIARRNLLPFVQYLRPNYMVGIHHRAICGKLDAFAKGEIKRLMIFVPPQHGKSELSSRYFPAKMLGDFPNKKIALASYSDELAGAFNIDVQRIIDTDEYRTIYGGTVLNGHRPAWGGVLQGYRRNSSIFEVVGQRGSFRTVGIGGPLTGQPVDIGIIDDPVKDRITAESESNRNMVWNWYTDVFLSRMNSNSQQLLLMTRWHEDDLAGRLLKQDETRAQQGLPKLWEVVEFPAVKEGPPTAADTREPGEPLWPEMHNLASLMEKKEAGGDRSWESLYQQHPTAAKGNIIKVERFGEITWEEFADLTRNDYVEWNFKVDGAFTKKADNDATALYASHFNARLNTLFIRESMSVRLEFPGLLAYIPQFVQRNGYGPFSRIKVEPKANGLSIIQSMQVGTALNVEPYLFPKIEGTRLDDKDKVTRAIAITPKVDAGRVVLIKGDWNKTFRAQCAAFPLGKHDDEVDCLVMDLLECFFTPKAKSVSSGN